MKDILLKFDHPIVFLKIWWRDVRFVTLIALVCATLAYGHEWSGIAAILTVTTMVVILAHFSKKEGANKFKEGMVMRE